MKGTKYTRSKLIRAWRMINIDNMSCSYVAKEFDVSGKSISNWVKKVENDEDLLKAASKNKDAGITKEKDSSSSIERLKDEVKFLRW